MKSILITGGAGFIGSHTSLLLLEKGYKVFIIDSFINSSDKSLERISAILKKQGINIEDRLYFIKGDLRKPSDIEKAFEMSFKFKNPIRAVIHFAGLKSVYDSVKDPLNYWENNINGTINLLKVMEKYSCKNIVFSSSATVYRTQANKLLKEDDICEPVNPYGNNKLTIENILKDIYKSEPSQWRIASLRYFNPVGAHESGLIGENPMGTPNNLYPRITQVAIGKINEIKIYGSDWQTSDGTGVRDYIHVLDLAEGHLLTLDYILKENPQILTLNLGTGKGTSVLEFINTFETVNKVKVPFSFVERRQGDNAFVVADNSLAKSILNWIPNRNIKDMCRDGWNWQLKNPNGY
ncbi:UDP-glucose 4-epimerase GalE [Prochlorococcus marinus XMU1410]|uniref:UDP-glucose 4-epimerase GalE n=1 Tax=Prochlorococcus marinus TaxID=1219 RepID=UPI001ADADF60|nr:UDP-glucose 4-epimerase GalE [Prochlorococcus marinus]MBO8242361.1 UDP-glucose 4-epimerase GalE [Prochlorococcus marinus XMU1410]MBW3053508.1 UDP-glucose 4-epimerase GalE [Prochlorococcus marinus str. MU1410]